MTIRTTAKIRLHGVNDNTNNSFIKMTCATETAQHKRNDERWDSVWEGKLTKMRMMGATKLVQDMPCLLLLYSSIIFRNTMRTIAIIYHLTNVRLNY